MVDRLGFESVEAALALRDEYFRKYHSTLKGLTVADEEGKLRRPFVRAELGEYWSKHCDFERFLERDETLIRDLAALPQRIVVFTNAPRAYGLRCLETMGLIDLVDRVFGVEDVMPHCKPEPEAFRAVLGDADPRTCLMVEDSMKNIRACHALGMRTVLVREPSLDATSEAALLGDRADDSDPAVDVVITRIQELRAALPALWDRAPP